MTKERLYGIDILRFFSFCAIIIFHTEYAIWGPLGIENIPVQGPWSWPTEMFARSLDFSGFTIVFLSFFLFGFNPGISRKWKYLWWILFGFFLVWAFVGGDFPYIWDIYPYLLVVTALLAVLRRVSPWILLVAGAAMVSIPFWQWEGVFDIPRWLEGPLVGACQYGDHFGEDWPLLPWIAYPVFAFGAGRLAARYRHYLSGGSWWEAAVWLVLLIASIPFLGLYFFTPLGHGFACYMFRQSPFVFWAHQLWVLWFVRLSFLGPVARELARNRVVAWFSARPINRHFFLVYFIHYPICLAWGDLARAGGFAMTQYPMTLGFVSCIILIESISIVVRKVFCKNLVTQLGESWSKIVDRSRIILNRRP